jgi:hypothetical protein
MSKKMLLAQCATVVALLCLVSSATLYAKDPIKVSVGDVC